MPIPGIVRGQQIEEAQRELAKKLRREMTLAESILWSKLRRNQLNGFHFRRQQIIRGFVADFYCHASSLVVEVDGEVHNLKKEYDSDREQIFRELGLNVIRFRNDEVIQHLESVLAMILNRCIERSPDPPAPFPRGKGENSNSPSLEGRGNGLGEFKPSFFQRKEE